MSTQDGGEGEQPNIPAPGANLNPGGGEGNGGPTFESRLKKYPMRDRRGGVAVIINNQEFNTFIQRKGSCADKMYKMFNMLGFEQIYEKPNLTTDQIKDFLEKESFDFSNILCFVCVILSYGDEGYFYGIGGEHDMMGLSEIVDHFKGNKCGALIDIPKLFFVQTCPKRIKEQRDKPFSPEAHVEEEEEGGYLVSVEADILLTQSCIPGIYEWQKEGHETNPSWFIEALTQTIEINNEDILSMLTEVNRKLLKKARDNNDKRINLPTISSTLRNDLFLKA